MPKIRFEQRLCHHRNQKPDPLFSAKSDTICSHQEIHKENGSYRECRNRYGKLRKDAPLAAALRSSFLCNDFFHPSSTNTLTGLVAWANPVPEEPSNTRTRS